MADKAAAVKELRRFAQSMRNLLEFADSLEDVAALDRVEAETLVRVGRLRSEAEGLEKMRGAADADLQAARDAAAQEGMDAKIAAEEMVAKAQQEASDIVEKAKSVAADVKKAAQQMADKAQTKITEAEGRLAQLEAEIVAREAVLSGVNLKLEEVRARL